MFDGFYFKSMRNSAKLLTSLKPLEIIEYEPNGNSTEIFDYVSSGHTQYHHISPNPTMLAALCVKCALLDLLELTKHVLPQLWSSKLMQPWMIMDAKDKEGSRNLDVILL